MTDTSKIFLDAVLTPNKPLSPVASRVVLGLVLALSVIAGSAFLRMGAFPVVGFFGLDALAIWAALRWSRRRQSQETRITINCEAISLSHRDGRGHEKHVELPTAFTRIDLDRPAKPNSWLSLRHGQRILVIGRFLLPAERESLADAMQRALNQARAARY